MKNIKYAVAASLTVMIFAGSAGVAFAQTSSTTDALLTQIQTLLKQVKSLQDQMSALDAQRGQLTFELNKTLQLTRSLSLGMTSDEVKLLQEMLASDPEVYPEGLVTGYYGPMTQKAVKKFQAKMGIEQVGNVGPKTREKINSMMLQGVGSAGKLPPGLAKKLNLKVASTTAVKDSVSEFKVTVCHKPAGANPQTLSVGAPALSAHLTHGDSAGACGTTSNNNASTTKDVLAPVISNLASASGTTTAYVSWVTNEKATSTMWYSSTTPVSTTTASKVENNSLRTAHSYNLTGLTATTTYYYLIKVSDAAGNSATTTEHSFKTLDN